MVACPSFFQSAMKVLVTCERCSTRSCASATRFFISASAICSADPVNACAEAEDCAANCEIDVAMRSYVLASSR